MYSREAIDSCDSATHGELQLRGCFALGINSITSNAHNSDGSVPRTTRLYETETAIRTQEVLRRVSQSFLAEDLEKPSGFNHLLMVASGEALGL